jgi:hypothetical protein
MAEPFKVIKTSSTRESYTNSYLYWGQLQLQLNSVAKIQDDKSFDDDTLNLKSSQELGHSMLLGPSNPRGVHGLYHVRFRILYSRADKFTP